MTQVKLVHHPVEQACADLKSAAEGLQTSFKAEIKGDSKLDIADRINQLNASYSNLLSSYQKMLLEHIEATEKTAKTLKATDIKLSSALTFIEN